MKHNFGKYYLLIVNDNDNDKKCLNVNITEIERTEAATRGVL